MGEALYHALLAELPELTCRVYAPVGGYADLLAYLVRRLLENGANSSFVSVAADPAVPVETVLRRPQSWIGGPDSARHPHIPLPRDLFAPERRNSSGVEFGDSAALAALHGRDPRRAGERHRRAADRRRFARRPRAPRDVADRRQKRRRRRGGRRSDRRGGDERGASRFPGMERDAGRRRAPRRWSAPAT